MNAAKAAYNQNSNLKLIISIVRAPFSRNYRWDYVEQDKWLHQVHKRWCVLNLSNMCESINSEII
jgi:hypothetical protein